MKAFCFQGAFQRFGDVFLSENIVKCLRAKFSGDDLVRQGRGLSFRNENDTQGNSPWQGAGNATLRFSQAIRARNFFYESYFPPAKAAQI